ncbi:MAG: hypothetical protein DRG78_08805 [Epsilonproteobacteria bacterium]|nr:MAG: hypothetical protein DRG78_08805 [Campylobacterota bacterium]
MKINIEDYLHKIDSAFKEKSQKDTYMTYAVIVAIIFAFSYLLFWDSSFEEFESTRTKVVQLEKKIKDDRAYLKANPESKITNLEKQIVVINKKMQAHKSNNNYIKGKIETISSLIYDERAWGEYLHSISKNAKKYNVKITNLTNKYSDNTNAFGHILDISVKSSSSYKNTLRFINSLEQSDLVVDLHYLDIKAQDKLNTELKISVWGITY